jgi:hypothetical protein
LEIPRWTIEWDDWADHAGSGIRDKILSKVLSRPVLSFSWLVLSFLRRRSRIGGLGRVGAGGEAGDEEGILCGSHLRRVGAGSFRRRGEQDPILNAPRSRDGLS